MSILSGTDRNIERQTQKKSVLSGTDRKKLSFFATIGMYVFIIILIVLFVKHKIPCIFPRM